MWKLFLNTALTEIITTVLSSYKGQYIFKGKGIITETSENSATLELTLGKKTFSLTVKEIT